MMFKGSYLSHRPTSLSAVRLARFTASAEDIAAECRSLLRALRVPFGDIRGMGITVSGRAGGRAGGWVGGYG